MEISNKGIRRHPAPVLDQPLFIENTSRKGLSQAEEKAQKYYQACMNEAKIEELGARPLEDLISQVRVHTRLIYIRGAGCLHSSDCLSKH